MTEKRFELRLCSNGIYYVYENGTLTDIDFDKFNKESAYALLDEVNALYDENGQLRKENDMLSCELSVSANKEISRNCRIAELEEENEQLKQKIKKLEAQLYKVEDGVCDICNNMYLVQQGRYFVSKCKKGHDECSKMDLDYCDDFELKDGDV